MTRKKWSGLKVTLLNKKLNQADIKLDNPTGQATANSRAVGTVVALYVLERKLYTKTPFSG
jgi:hypothetical protein